MKQPATNTQSITMRCASQVQRTDARAAMKPNNGLHPSAKISGDHSPPVNQLAPVPGHGSECAQLRNESHMRASPLAANPSPQERRYRAHTIPFHRPAEELSNGGAQGRDDAHLHTSPAVAEIVQLWRLRQRWHRAEKALTLQGRAMCRAWTDGDKDSANKLFDKAEDGEAVDAKLQMALEPYLAAIQQFRPLRLALEKRLKKLAQIQPEWSWVQSVKGFGPMNFAAITGETGGIGMYRNPSCVWKRMGLAVIDGARQRKVTDPEMAEIHGYNPSRRAVAFNLGECIIKAGGPYKTVYDERKALELQTEGRTPIHAHRRAARYMVKRILRDLWRVSRDQGEANTRSCLDTMHHNASASP